MNDTRLARIRSVRGMKDVLPEETPTWRKVESAARALFERYGFGEIRTPVVERTELFARSIGEVTDIVEKEMYTFLDRNGESLSLRPEATASCVRAAIDHGLLTGVHRLWYMGPMFRHERPQKGRYRQFHQIGAEIFGAPGPAADAELIVLTARLWEALGLTDVRLEVNTLGTPEVRRRHREALIGYLERHRAQLDEDARRRLETNPLRILDSKNPEMASLLAQAPRLLDYLDDEAGRHFSDLQSMLRACGVEFEINPRLVRGLDYYTHTVFEWVTTELGAQGTICGGGRYDGLVAQIGGTPTPGTGFSIGVERLVELLEHRGLHQSPRAPDVYVVTLGEDPERAGPALAEEIRSRLPDASVVLDPAPGRLRAKLRRADRSGAALAVVLGEDEIASGTVQVKPLRGQGEQVACPRERLGEALGRWLGGESPAGEGTGRSASGAGEQAAPAPGAAAAPPRQAPERAPGHAGGPAGSAPAGGDQR